MRDLERPRFTIPAAWSAFCADIDRRTGKPIATYGLVSVAMHNMTADEQDRAELMLRGFLAIAEAAPKLDVDLHGWARLALDDVRVGQYHRCRREGCLRDLMRRRNAERKALLWNRVARELAA
jgi:hypothetical protein